MTETKTKKSQQDFLLSYYITIASLIVLIDKSSITNVVKKHCKTGLKVIGIIYANQAYGEGINTLSKKEFDAFFKLFPLAYFNDRESISVSMIVKNLKLCLATDDIVYLRGE